MSTYRRTPCRAHRSSRSSLRAHDTFSKVLAHQPTGPTRVELSRVEISCVELSRKERRAQTQHTDAAVTEAVEELVFELAHAAQIVARRRHGLGAARNLHLLDHRWRLARLPHRRRVPVTDARRLHYRHAGLRLSAQVHMRTTRYPRLVGPRHMDTSDLGHRDWIDPTVNEKQREAYV